MCCVCVCVWCVCVCVVCVVRRLSGAVLRRMQPLSDLLVGCLNSHLSVYCRLVNTHLLHVLSCDHQLLDCFATIRVRTQYISCTDAYCLCFLSHSVDCIPSIL